MNKVESSFEWHFQLRWRCQWWNDAPGKTREMGKSFWRKKEEKEKRIRKWCWDWEHGKDPIKKMKRKATLGCDVNSVHFKRDWEKKRIIKNSAKKRGGGACESRIVEASFPPLTERTLEQTFNWFESSHLRLSSRNAKARLHLKVELKRFFWCCSNLPKM